MSCKSRKITASRSSGDSFCSAKCTISRVSRPWTAASGAARLYRRSGRPAAAHRRAPGGAIQRIRHSIALTLAEMVDQQISRDGGDPGHKRTLTGVIGTQGAVHLDKDFLGEVLCGFAVARKAVADVINAPVKALNDLLPGRGIATHAATDEQLNDLGFFQNQTPNLAGVSL